VSRPLRAKSLMEGRQFLYEIVKIYANQNNSWHTSALTL
jgi:hypothetical protein